MENIKLQIKDVFTEIADGLETGSFGKRTAVGITTLGSEISADNLRQGAFQFAKDHPGVDVVLIGPVCPLPLPNLFCENASTEEEQHKVMERLLDEGRIQACVTQHYNFPIGVSTVGRVITPGLGRNMMIANTTGISSPHRVESMVLNAVAGIITAKASGVEYPTVGILNVDGARKVEQALQKLKDGGYEFQWVSSERADGGAIMRGNDVILGTPDVMVTDSLTGNILMKVFSSFTTGGTYESLGYGYGPGIGEGYDRVILILSRVSGIPVVSNALSYAATIIRHDVLDIAKKEYALANKAGLKDILEGLKAQDKPKAEEEEIKAPPKEVVTENIAGIDIMELEDAVKVLWKENIYAQSGMGCTGPIVQVSQANIKRAVEILNANGYTGKPEHDC